MDWELYASFVAAVTLLMIMPGPTVAFILGNSVQHGLRAGLLAVGGTSAAIVVHLLSAALSMRMLLHVLAGVFEWLRWGAVLYLLWLAYSAWGTRNDEHHPAQTRPSRSKIIGRAFLISLTNPKTLIFYSVFFPHFISPEHEVEPQLLALGITFLVMAVLLGSCWAIAAEILKGVSRSGRNRVTAALFAFAAAALAAAPKG